MDSGARHSLIEIISRRIGFSFKEDELSPKLRREIGEVAKKKEYYDRLASLLVASEADASNGIAVTVFITVIGLGGLFLGLYLLQLFLVGIGAAILVFALIVYKSFYQKNKTIVDLKKEEAQTLWSDLDNRTRQLSELIYNELSLLHETKVRPTVKHIVIDFAGIIQAARGKGIILSSIECPHCDGVVEIPPTGEYFECQYCGKTIHATKIFDKLKDILT